MTLTNNTSGSFFFLPIKFNLYSCNRFVIKPENGSHYNDIFTYDIIVNYICEIPPEPKFI